MTEDSEYKNGGDDEHRMSFVVLSIINLYA
jgi:hypothetical protein